MVRLGRIPPGAVMAVCLGLVTAVAAQEQPSREDFGKLTTNTLKDRALRWRCEAKTKFVCSAAGCKPIPSTVWVSLDFATHRYERCDSKGCDSSPATPKSSGIYTVISPNPGTFLKVVNDGSDFVEVASLGTRTFTAFGRCTPIE